ncbi:MAG: tetratricopeptide repeat protein, partial [Gemmatimonadota bacterium]|nr:tetratricopeptide repeat protein [Gemmatimonadota bacterium]
MSEQAGALATLIESAHAAVRAGALDEALAHYQAAYCRLPAEGDAASAAELLRWTGTTHRLRNDLETAGELYEASLAVAEAAGLRDQVAQGLNCLGIVEQLRGQLPQAETLYARAQRLAEEVGEARLAAMISQNLGTLANIRGDVEAALARYGAALEWFRRLGDDLSSAWSLNNMGMAHVDLEQWEQAAACFDEAFRLADRVHDADTLGSVELNRAELYLQQQRFDDARECCDRAFEIFDRLGQSAGVAEACKLYGALYRETGKPGLAERHLASAVEMAQACGDLLLEAESHSERALVHMQEKRSREALQALNRAHRLFHELGARREVLDLERRLGELEGIYLRVVRAWGESIESKDRYTAGHCQRVADYACMLAEAVGFAGRDLVWFRMGAFLHDVGKIETPEEVLNKPGKLNPEEWAVMQAHTVEGDRIVAELNFPWDIRPIVRSHHERWDGSG